ncbi:MAG: cytochrome P450 [Dehalococcoidia bacterium]
MSDTASGPCPAPEGYRPEAVDFVANPHDVLRAMREEARVHVHQSPLGPRYVLTHYDDVNAFFRRADVFRDTRKLPEDDIRRRGFLPQDEDDRYGQPSILTLDPPEHDRLRGLVSQAFTPKAIEAMNPRIAEIADELLDAVAGEEIIDFMDALAVPLPVIVIAEMIGVDPGDRAQFKAWAHALIEGGLTGRYEIELLQRAREAGRQLRAYFERTIDERRKNPKDDLMSALIAVEQEGERMTREEMITMLQLLLNAGNLTTTDLLGNGLLALLSHPGEYQRLRDDPSLMASAVEEMLRFTPPVTGTGRMTVDATEVAGCPVPRHATVTGSILAANRDPDVFEDPERFDITRKRNHHLSFGGGIHFCLGASLARNEARIALERLFARYNHIELAIDPAQVPWRGGGAFRGLASLPIRVR